MQRNARKNMSYSFDIKLKAVKMYLEEGIGSTTIAKELNLSSNKRVLLWVKRFNEFYFLGFLYKNIIFSPLNRIINLLIRFFLEFAYLNF